ncbi:MAG: hypothetical protein ACLQUY_03995 [Ktedonobacterales bacterium]
MRSVGIVLAIVGILVVVAGLLNHFALHFTGSSAHASVIIGAVGAVLLIIGVVILMMGGGAKQAA